MGNTEYLKELLKKKGLKMTTQRGIILEAMSECPGQHLTAEEVYELVRVKRSEIGIATVYRTLQLLSELNLVDTLDLDDGQLRYELVEEANEGQHHHHHLICNRCGKVLEFQEDMMDELEAKIEATTGFKIKDHRVKMYGYCVDCRKEMALAAKEDSI